MKRCNFLSVKSLQIFHYLTVTCIVNIHICHKDHTWKMIFFTDFPGAPRACLDSRFSGNNDNCCIRCGNCLFDFPDKIKIAWGIQNINFAVFPRDRDHRSMDRKLAFRLLLIKITDGIFICDRPHTCRQTCQICHGFHQGSFAASSMPQENHITNSVCRIYVHSKTLLF